MCNYQLCTNASYTDAVHYLVEPGNSMTTVLLQVSQGKRPCLEIIPERKPEECVPIISIMKQCWDQDHRKRPPFSGKITKALLYPVFFTPLTVYRQPLKCFNKAQ